MTVGKRVFIRDAVFFFLDQRHCMCVRPHKDLEFKST